MTNTPAIHEIIKSVSDYTKVSEADILSQCKKAEIIFARHLCFYISVSLYKYNLCDVAEVFNVHHTTVMNGKNSIKKQLNLKHHPKYINAVAVISNRLNYVI